MGCWRSIQSNTSDRSWMPSSSHTTCVGAPEQQREHSGRVSITLHQVSKQQRVADDVAGGGPSSGVTTAGWDAAARQHGAAYTRVTRTCRVRSGDIGGTRSCSRHSCRQICSGTKSARAPINCPACSSMHVVLA